MREESIQTDNRIEDCYNNVIQTIHIRVSKHPTYHIKSNKVSFLTEPIVALIKERENLKKLNNRKFEQRK